MKHYCISLLDVVHWVKGQYRDYVIATLQSGQSNSAVRFPNSSWEFNHMPFFEALMTEIFVSPQSASQNALTESPSVAALMQVGLGRDFASYISREAFKLCVDIISSHLPEIRFGDEESFSYGLCDEYDILITSHFE